MRLLNVISNRKNAQTADAVAGFPERQPGGKDEAGVFADQATSDSDTLSLEARNEKEIELHPDQVTRGAELGVQKAEAAALVWSRKAVLATYAW